MLTVRRENSVCLVEEEDPTEKPKVSLQYMYTSVQYILFHGKLYV